MQPVDMVFDWFRWGKDSDALSEEVKGGYMRPLFIPLQKSQSQSDVFGIPTIDLSLNNAGEEDPLVFVGLGVKRSSKSRVELIDYQIKALKGREIRQQELPAVSVRLQQGDTLGLLVYGYHSHYMFQGSFWPDETRLQGTLTLPFLAQNN